MLVACWSPKGGVGTTLVSAALGLVLARSSGPVVLADLAGDLPLVLGAPPLHGPGLADWLAAAPNVPADALSRIEHRIDDTVSLLPRGDGPLPADRARGDLLARVLAAEPAPVVVDCGRTGAASDADGPATAVLAGADRSLLVLRPCFVALRRAADSPLRPDGIVVVEEPFRALRTRDVESVLDAPVVATIRWSDAVARAVDAGLLVTRLPRSLADDLRHAA